jgi:SNF2 family DNA or RNA helicase
MLNWEMELKKWCPAFKILTYYGSQKERKQKRTGMLCVLTTSAFHFLTTSAFPFEEEYIIWLTSLPTGKESNVTFPTSQDIS